MGSEKCPCKFAVFSRLIWAHTEGHPYRNTDEGTEVAVYVVVPFLLQLLITWHFKTSFSLPVLSAPIPAVQSCNHWDGRRLQSHNCFLVGLLRAWWIKIPLKGKWSYECTWSNGCVRHCPLHVLSCTCNVAINQDWRTCSFVCTILQSALDFHVKDIANIFPTRKSQLIGPSWWDWNPSG